MADWENPSEWFGGRLAIGRDLLKRLNATASQVEKEEMGIRVRPPSSPSWQFRLSVMRTLSYFTPWAKVFLRIIQEKGCALVG
jgi:hypothetical protein